MKNPKRPTTAEVKKLIKEKFRTITRFCRLSGLNYKEVMKSLQKKDPQQIMYLYIMVNDTDDLPLESELTNDQKMEIRIAIMRTRHDTLKGFCKEHDIDATWLSRLLSNKDYSASRTNSPNLKRLLKILNLQL